ncbi:DUF1887 family CARF protein [Vibrio lentus]|nr:DUF1887 family CARF protein [Vibrio lentus]
MSFRNSIVNTSVIKESIQTCRRPQARGQEVRSSTRSCGFTSPPTFLCMKCYFYHWPIFVGGTKQRQTVLVISSGKKTHKFKTASLSMTLLNGIRCARGEFSDVQLSPQLDQKAHELGERWASNAR